MKWYLPTLIFILFSCGQKQLKESRTDLFVSPGDIVATSNTADDIISIDPNGLDVTVLTQVDRTVDKVVASTWMHTTDELLFLIDGQDRVIGYNPVDGSTREVIKSSFLNGNLRGITQLSNGDILIAESNNIERFTSSGIRIGTGNFPVALNTVYKVLSMPNSTNFVACAGGTADSVSLYDNDGNQLGTDAGPGGGHEARGCAVDMDGTILVAWYGTNDQVWRYDSDLSNGTKIVDNADINIMSTPHALSISHTGNFYVADYTNHNIIEFMADGTFVRTFGILHDCTDLFTIP